MKVYINGYGLSRKPIVAYIDNVVISTETLYDGYVYEEKAVDVRQIKNIINALELMGETIKRIVVYAHYSDFDTKYYHRFPDEIIDKIYNTLCERWSKGIDVYIKGNRIYTKVDDYEIVLPKEMYDDYDEKTLRVEFYV